MASIDADVFTSEKKESKERRCLESGKDRFQDWNGLQKNDWIVTI